MSRNDLCANLTNFLPHLNCVVMLKNSDNTRITSNVTNLTGLYRYGEKYFMQKSFFSDHNSERMTKFAWYFTVILKNNL